MSWFTTVARLCFVYVSRQSILASWQLPHPGEVYCGESYALPIHPGPVPSPNNHRAVLSIFAHGVYGIKVVVTKYRVMHMIVFFTGIPWELPGGHHGIPRPPTWISMSACGSPRGTTGLPVRARHHGHYEKTTVCTLMCFFSGNHGSSHAATAGSHGLPRGISRGSPRGTTGYRRMPRDTVVTPIG